ncbi:MAG: flavodoxin [Bacilli bacterium]|jgi:menaquinone-dependent protoporphyrinogen IX oxidase|nr:flavodoxin [Bacilli bacterium]
MENKSLKIAIIIHSKTGNTLSVAEKIKDKLVNLGHQVALERVTASNNDEPEVAKIELSNKPGVEGYDAYVFGAPVNGFMLSGVMRAYLAQISELGNKPVYCFLTQYFPFRWMGGNNALRQFKIALNKKSALVKGTGIVNWSNKKRDALIDNTVNIISF